MSLKPKHTRLHEPKFREREDHVPDAEKMVPTFDVLSLAQTPLAALGPCSNPILAERLKEALAQSR